jgi:hypothetical protein
VIPTARQFSGETTPSRARSGRLAAATGAGASGAASEAASTAARVRLRGWFVIGVVPCQCRFCTKASSDQKADGSSDEA